MDAEIEHHSDLAEGGVVVFWYQFTLADTHVVGPSDVHQQWQGAGLAGRCLFMCVNVTSLNHITWDPCWQCAGRVGAKTQRH